MVKKKQKRKRKVRQPTKAEIVGQRFAGIHNQALFNSQRDLGIREKIKERMKEEGNEARLLDLEKRRQELLK